MHEVESQQNLLYVTIASPEFRRAVFAGATRGEKSTWVRVSLRPVELRGLRHIQFEFFDGRKTVVKNCMIEEVKPPIDELLRCGYSGIHLETNSEVIDVRTSKKGKVHIGRKKITTKDDLELSHNRVKDLPLPEGRADRVLQVMGIMTEDGKVRPSMRSKYSQINEFLKHLTHVLPDSGLKESDHTVRIIDCGCGSSYLTIAAHHYLHDILGIRAEILGVDINDEVIRKSSERAERLDLKGLTFASGKISTLDVRADIVIALHACDTATDDAIAQAVRSLAKLLLCAPCCHHDLNKSIRAEGEAAILRPILRHGILRERTADIVTDAFRAQILRILGWKTDIVEFVGSEHTPRNLLIRALRTGGEVDFALIREYREMKRFWDASPYLEKLLESELEELGEWTRI